MAAVHSPYGRRTRNVAKELLQNAGESVASKFNHFF